MRAVPSQRHGSGSAVITLLLLALVGLAVVLVVWRSDLTAPRGNSTPDPGRSVSARVVESTPCGARAPGDLVEIEVDGRPMRIRFDGCGHVEGQRVQGWIPSDPGQDTVVRSSKPDDVAEAAELRAHLNWVLLTLAGAAGAGYAVMLRPRR